MVITSTESWTEFCAIGISRENDPTTETQFAALTEDITAMDWGEKDIEGVPLVNGGRVVKRTPMTDESITLKMYPVSVGIDGTGGLQHMHPQTNSGVITDDSTEPLVAFNMNKRQKHRLCLLWSTTPPGTASGIPVATDDSYRIEVLNAYMTSWKPSFDDKHLSVEATFKWAPFNQGRGSTPVGNKKEESVDRTAQLSAANTTSVTTWTSPPTP